MVANDQARFQETQQIGVLRSNVDFKRKPLRTANDFFASFTEVDTVQYRPLSVWKFFTKSVLTSSMPISSPGRLLILKIFLQRRYTVATDLVDEPVNTPAACAERNNCAYGRNSSWYPIVAASDLFFYQLIKLHRQAR